MGGGSQEGEGGERTLPIPWPGGGCQPPKPPNPGEVYPLVTQQLTYHLGVCARYLQFAAFPSPPPPRLRIMAFDWRTKLHRGSFQLRLFYFGSDLHQLNVIGRNYGSAPLPPPRIPQSGNNERIFFSSGGQNAFIKLLFIQKQRWLWRNGN